MNSKDVLIFGLLFFSYSTLIAQNLVRNPSFEELDKRSNIGIKYWRSAYDASSMKGFTLNRTDNLGLTVAVDQDPRTGDSYVGMLMYKSSLDISISSSIMVQGDHGRVLQTRLSQDLVHGSIYRIQFYINLADTSDATIKRYGVYFSKSAAPKNYRGQPDISFKLNQRHENKSKWILLSGEYTAKGGERYLTIGLNNSEYDIMSRLLVTEWSRSNTDRKFTHLAYYFIDDVSLEVVAESHILKNVTFKTGSSELLPSSFPELNNLHDIIEKSTETRILISGHTDNIGDHDSNLELSQKRAQAVVDYLISKGVNSNRLKAKGFGSSQPKEDNSTELGKATNRRVEFVIMKR